MCNPNGVVISRSAHGVDAQRFRHPAIELIGQPPSVAPGLAQALQDAHDRVTNSTRRPSFRNATLSSPTSVLAEGTPCLMRSAV